MSASLNGDHAGSEACNPSRTATSTPVPSLFTISIVCAGAGSLPPNTTFKINIKILTRTKAILVPSGDHTGSRSSDTFSISMGTTTLSKRVFKSTTRISKLRSSETNAISLPFGDHVGCEPVTRCSSFLPSMDAI